MTAKETNYDGVIKDLLDEIGKETSEYVRDHSDDALKIFGTAKVSHEMIIEKLYDGGLLATNPIVAALGIQFFISAITYKHTLPANLAFYNIGILRTYISVSTISTELPKETKILVHKQLVGLNSAEKWADRNQNLSLKLAGALTVAEQKWKNGDEAYHHEMAKYLIGKFPEIKAAIKKYGVTKKRKGDDEVVIRQVLMEHLKPIARKYGRVKGDPKRS